MNWNSYNANVVPDAANSITSTYGSATAFTYNTSTGYTPNVFASLGNGIVSFINGGSKGQIRVSGTKDPNNGDSVVGVGYPKYFTWVARAKANSATDRAIEVEVALADADTDTSASRVKFVIGDNTLMQGVQFDTIDGVSGTPANKPTVAVDTSQWHIYQVSIAMTDATHGTVSLYVDGQLKTETTGGSALPYSGVLNAATGSLKRYLYVGTTGTNSYNGSLDWLVWTNQGAYSPAQIKGSLPAGLGDTTGY